MMELLREKKAVVAGGQKTPPFARAKRRGRNREEAKSTGSLTDIAPYVNLFLVIFTKLK
jgi:hypothetical protein